MQQEEREEIRRQRAEEGMWLAMQRLYHRRWIVITGTGLVAILSVVITLLLPNWYRASSRLLIPESQGSSLSAAVLGNLPAAASALLGGGAAGDYTRYLAILTSRSMMESVVDEFDLITVYETEDDEFPKRSAVETLEEKAEFEVDMEFDFLSISVLDKEPERAAAMANFFVARLNEANARLTSEGASNYRRSIERRYIEARSAIDSVLSATQQFQSEHGVYDLPAQTQAFFQQVGSLRQSALEAEIQFEALRAQYGPENAQVQAMQLVVEAADRKYEQALAGSEYLLPVSQLDMPEVAREFVELELERTIHRNILEVIGPLYEQAKFQEERDTQAVQVVDSAVPPELKAKPVRSIICIVATLTAFLLCVIFVLVLEWWKDNHEAVLRRIQATGAR